MISALYLILFFAVVLILLLLFLPVRLHLVLDEKRRSIILGWFFVVVGADLVSRSLELRLFSQRILSRKLRKKREEEEAKKIKKIKRAKKKGRRFDILDLWKERDLLTRILPVLFRFVRDMLRGIHLDRLIVEADIATPDPALTGAIYGGLYALSVPTNFVSPNVRLKVKPDFENEIPGGRAEVAFSSRLANAIGAVSKMFLALPKIKIIRILIKTKRR